MDIILENKNSSNLSYTHPLLHMKERGKIQRIAFLSLISQEKKQQGLTSWNVRKKTAHARRFFGPSRSRVLAFIARSR